MKAKLELEQFLEQQMNEGYTLGNIEGTPEADMLKYTELKIAMKQEADAFTKFQTEKNEAFDAQAKLNDQASQVLGTEWQTKEDSLFN